MTSLSDFGVPGIGVGILHPMMIHDWRAGFLDDAGSISEEYMPIAAQLLSISPYKQFANVKYPSELTLTLEEDVTCKLSRAVQKLITETGPLKFVIENLDGTGTPLRRTVFHDVKVIEYTHGEVDYAGGGCQVAHASLNLRHHEDRGTLIEDLKNDPAAKAMIMLFNGSTISWHGNRKPGTIQSKLMLQYSDLTVAHLIV